MSQPGPKTGPEMAHLEKVSLSPEGPRPAGRLMLLVMMRYYRFGKGRIFPSEQRLSSDTGMTVRSVQRVLQELERDGWIRRHIHGARGQGWRRYEYELAWPRGYDPQANAWLTEVGRRKAAGRKAFREEHGWQPEATPDSKPQRLEEFLADYWEGQAAESPPEPSPPPDQTPVSEVFDYWRAVMEVVDPDPPQLPPPVLDLAPPLPGIDPAAWERLILHWRHREFHVTREQAAEVARRVQRHPQQVALIHQVIDRNLSEHWPG